MGRVTTLLARLTAKLSHGPWEAKFDSHVSANEVDGQRCSEIRNIVSKHVN